jgi:hypothetical protein
VYGIVENMKDAWQTDMDRAARMLRAAAATALSVGIDEDQVFALVEDGVNDARDWPTTTGAQARNAANGWYRPDGEDTPPTDYHDYDDDVDVYPSRYAA